MTAREAALGCLLAAAIRFREQTDAMPEEPEREDRDRLDDAERDLLAATVTAERYVDPCRLEADRILIATALRVAADQWEADQASMLREADSVSVVERAGYRRAAGQFQSQCERARTLLDEVFGD